MQGEVLVVMRLSLSGEGTQQANSLCVTDTVTFLLKYFGHLMDLYFLSNDWPVI